MAKNVDIVGKSFSIPTPLAVGETAEDFALQGIDGNLSD